MFRILVPGKRPVFDAFPGGVSPLLSGLVVRSSRILARVLAGVGQAVSLQGLTSEPCVTRF